MNRSQSAPWALATCFAFLVQQAHADLTVGIDPSDGIAMFAKRFQVEEGATIVGAEFRNNDARTVFPEVVLVRDAADRMADGVVVARALDVSETADGWVRVTWNDPHVVAARTEYVIGVRVPEGPGKQSSGDGPGVGAVVAVPGRSYLAVGLDGTLVPIGADLEIDLVYGRTAKAGAVREGQAVAWTGLSPPVPNPFNPTTTIEFGLERASDVRLLITDVGGRTVRDFGLERVEPGIHQRTWDGRNTGGQSVATGLYFVRLAVEDRTYTHKVVLVK